MFARNSDFKREASSAPSRARGTANSLRIMGNRLGQFVLPFGAGIVAAAAGLSALLLVMAAAIVTAAAAMHWQRPDS